MNGESNRRIRGIAWWLVAGLLVVSGSPLATAGEPIEDLEDLLEEAICYGAGKIVGYQKNPEFWGQDLDNDYFVPYDFGDDAGGVFKNLGIVKDTFTGAQYFAYELTGFAKYDSKADRCWDGWYEIVGSPLPKV